MDDLLYNMSTLNNVIKVKYEFTEQRDVARIHKTDELVVTAVQWSWKVTNEILMLNYFF